MLKEAQDLEAKCYAQTLENGQSCERWADVIEYKDGYGVPIKDRLDVAEKSLAVEWNPDAAISPIG